MKAKTAITPLLIAALLITHTPSPTFARYYDPGVGRFISADTIVQAPTDAQSFNRYAYVRNNPLGNVDPSGNSWLSKGIKEINGWINQHDEAFGVVLQSLDVFSGTAFLSSFENGRGILLGQTIAAGSFGVGGLSAGWGAMTGSSFGAYQARKTGGNLLGSIALGGIEGAIVANRFSAMSDAKAPFLLKAFGKSALSAGLTGVHGGDQDAMLLAAGITFAAEGAQQYFTHTVGYKADPTPGKRLSSPDQTYGGIKPNQGLDVFGSNDGSGGFFHQGSPAMRGASMVPGMQAVSQIHDTYMNTQHAAGSYLFGSFGAANVFTMAPALITSYAAQFSGPWAPAIYNFKK